jgi:acyl dehydratase
MKPNYFFEGVVVGVTDVSPEVTVDYEEMLAYNKANDPWPIHIDEVGAAALPFGGLIASGGYTITLTYRLGDSMAR